MPKMKYTSKTVQYYDGGNGRRYHMGAIGRVMDIHPDDVQPFRQSGEWVLLDSPYPALRYISEREIDILQEFARILPDNPTVINIGAGTGCSSLALMLARNDLHLITIDRQKESSPTGCLQAEYDTLVGAGIDMRRHRQVHGDSQEAGRNWNGGLVDMVFVDGDHSYDGAKGDILAWLPHIKTGGIMALHDYEQKPGGIWGEVFRAVADTLEPRFAKIGHVDTLGGFKIENAGERAAL